MAQQEDSRMWAEASGKFVPSFSPPPHQWSFSFKGISFGSSAPQPVDGCTLYELALLDIHSAYWESQDGGCTVKKYHRALQLAVERCFQSDGCLVRGTPSVLKPWLCRVMALRKHDAEGRGDMVKIIDQAGPGSALEHGRFSLDGECS